MIVEELWSEQDERDAAALVAAVRAGALAPALHAVEGVSGPPAEADLFLLDEWGRRVRPRVEGRSAAMQAAALAEVLSGELGFFGDTEDYHRVENSHLHAAMSRRKGLPILLSAIWMEVGRRAGLEVEGVGIPAHFVVRIGGPSGALADPFGGGRVVDRAGCKRIVEELTGGGIPWSDAYLAPTSLPAMLERVLKNLVTAHGRISDGRGLFRVASLLCRLRPDAADALLRRATVAEELGALAIAGADLAEIERRFPGTPVARDAAKKRRVLSAQRPN